jgi:hypothetical protein
MLLGWSRIGRTQRIAGLVFLVIFAIGAVWGVTRLLL